MHYTACIGGGWRGWARKRGRKAAMEGMMRSRASISIGIFKKQHKASTARTQGYHRKITCQATNSKAKLKSFSSCRLASLKIT
jgi:hypothetical protein